MTNKEFTLKYGPIALQATKGSGIFKETATSISIKETGSGKNITYNNFFNIVAGKSWKGKRTPVRRDWKLVNNVKVYYDVQFRAYDTPLEAFKDFVLFLKSNERYTKAGVFTAKNYSDQIRAIAKAGYAASPTYAASLITIANGITNYFTNVSKEVVNTVKKNPGKSATGLLLFIGLIILVTRK